MERGQDVAASIFKRRLGNKFQVLAATLLTTTRYGGQLFFDLQSILHDCSLYLEQHISHPAQFGKQFQTLLPGQGTLYVVPETISQCGVVYKRIRQTLDSLDEKYDIYLVSTGQKNWRKPPHLCVYDAQVWNKLETLYAYIARLQIELKKAMAVGQWASFDIVVKSRSVTVPSHFPFELRNWPDDKTVLLGMSMAIYIRPGLTLNEGSTKRAPGKATGAGTGAESTVETLVLGDISTPTFQTPPFFHSAAYLNYVFDHEVPCCGLTQKSLQDFFSEAEGGKMQQEDLQRIRAVMQQLAQVNVQRPGQSSYLPIVVPDSSGIVTQEQASATAKSVSPIDVFSSLASASKDVMHESNAAATESSEADIQKARFFELFEEFDGNPTTKGKSPAALISWTTPEAYTPWSETNGVPPPYALSPSGFRYSADGSAVSWYSQPVENRSAVQPAELENVSEEDWIR